MSTHLGNEQDDVKSFYPRFRLFYVMLFCSGFIIFSRLWYLQIINGQELRSYSEKNHVKEVKLRAPRGLLLDRDGHVLVENTPGYAAIISPQYATNLDNTAKAVAPILNLEPAEVKKMVKIGRRKYGPFRPVKIKENITLDQVRELLNLMLDNPGLDVEQLTLRSYPLGENGAQLFGYVGEISKRMIDKYNKKYGNEVNFKKGDIIGKGGLEEIWETKVRGKDGIRLVEVDVRGSEIGSTETPGFLELKNQEETPGNNLVLTIDKDLQEAAFNAMNRDDYIGPRIGGVVAIKSNGEILAWVNSPSYDPNQFASGISQKMWHNLVNGPFQPLRNKAIQDHYSPGSTFKPIVALAALQEEVITPTTTIYSPGSFKFGRRTYHDHSRSGHGNISVYQALEKSSNVFFYKMGISLGIDKIAKYARLLGLGQPTGIKLPNENPGLIPTEEWKLKKFGEPWQPGESLSNAIGQGYVETTALQMALAFNSIGLEGKLYKPFLVKKIISNENKLIKEFEPELVRDLTKPSEVGFIKRENFKAVKEGLRLVVNGSRGTARRHKISGIEMSGKTGTSQVRSFASTDIYSKCSKRPLKDRHHGSFVAYAPSDKPEIAVAVLALHSCSGSGGAAPIARDVILAYMKKYHSEWLMK